MYDLIHRSVLVVSTLPAQLGAHSSALEAHDLDRSETDRADHVLVYAFILSGESDQFALFVGEMKHLQLLDCAGEEVVHVESVQLDRVHHVREDSVDLTLLGFLFLDGREVERCKCADG